MLQAPDRSASRSRRGNKTRGNRANTTPQPLPDYLKDPNYKSPYAQNNTGLATITDNTQQSANGGGGGGIKSSQDDLLDLFSAFSTNNNNNGNNGNSGGASGGDTFQMNPFAVSAPNPSSINSRPHSSSDFVGGYSGGMQLKNRVNNNNNNNNNNNAASAFDSDPFDDFFGGGSSGGTTNTNTNNNNSNNKQSGDSKEDDDDDDEKEEAPPKKPIKLSARPSDPPPKPKKPKKKAKTRTVRASTEATVSMGTGLTSPSTNAPQPPKKTKSIDVLPLLHAGVKGNKFKFGQNKSKVRTFYLTKDNQWFCWEPVGGMLQAKNNRAKIDPTRSIFVRSIREVKKNNSSTTQGLSFIPAQHKSLTISIIYDQNGSEKKVSLMAYEPFHHVMIFEALHKLSTMGQNVNRDLGNVFELYVEFEKEILPKHLRPQRFKWEPLGAKDMTTNNPDTDGLQDDNPDGSGSALNSGGYGGTLGSDMDQFDPTQDSRDRFKSF